MLTPEIVGRARYLHERLREQTLSPAAPGEPSQDVSRRSPAAAEQADFLFWKQQFCTGGYDRFAERLDSLGITQQEAVYLSREPPSNETLAGGWAEIFEKALRQPALSLEGAEAFPFADLWLPLVSFARESVHPYAIDAALFTATALDGLLLTLLQDLSEFAAFPAFEVFSESRSDGEQLSDFNRRVTESGYLVLFDRFPMLGRQLSRLVTTWIDATTLFLRRFQADILDVKTFAKSQRARLAATKSGISDRHDNGRQVVLLTFDDGAKALYKPKNVSISETLRTISQWLAERGFHPGWRFARVVARGGYGWEEYIEQSPCSSHEQVRSYYRNGGELLCLAYLLNAYDLWRDNLIAAGDRPVPIDTECFFHPGRGTEASSADRHSGTGKASVIETGLLPLWQLSASHLPADFSGLGTGIVDLPELKVTVWEDVRSNDIRPITKPSPAKPATNTVRWQDKAQDVREYRANLIDGFCALYRTILDHKVEFVGFLNQFGQAEARFIYRPTQVYGLLQKAARSSRNLTSGIRQSAIFEQLYRVPLRENGLTAQTKELIDFEVESLLGLDIPRFNVRLDTRDLRSADFCVRDVLRRKPLDTVRERISAMGEEDLNFQLEVIHESLNRHPTQIKRPLDKKEAASIASEWADQIRRRMNVATSGHLWEIPSYLPRDLGIAERQGIYLGDLGILIFLAATEKMLGFKCFPETSHFRGRLKDSGLAADYPLGICNGLGASIYASLLLGALTVKDSWTELALSLNAKTAPLSKINSLDITSGVAGFLLATTRLFQSTQDACAKTNAEAAATILANCFDPNAGWRQPDGNSYLGFAHGLAGIVFALEQYQRVTGDPQYQPLIKQALALENEQFADHSWPNMLHGPRRTFKNWCHGTAGILMMRAATGALEPERFAPDELAHLLEKVGRRGQADLWCCGNFGIAEALNYIGQEANLPEAQKRGVVLLEETLERGLKGGFFRLESTLGENFCFSPSLFRGTAGIGYSLLRLAYPGELPCILAFEV
jgi:type 2 lantibiotic biosynthesis protein LanM